MENIGSMDDIQNLFKETIAEFMENGLEAELDDELNIPPRDGHLDRLHQTLNRSNQTPTPPVRHALYNGCASQDVIQTTGGNSITNYKEIFRLHSLGLNNTRIAESCNCVRSTVIAAL